MKTYLLSGLVLALTSGATMAQSTPWIDGRERTQGHRIYNGIASGDLSYGEASRLVKGQAHVRNLEQRVKSDGVVTPFERLRVHVALSRQSNRIHRLRNN